MKTLKPRMIGTARRNMAILDTVPGATPRQYGRPWARRRAAWLQAHPLCIHCHQAGRVQAAAEVDHVIPLADGGADDDSNMQSLCRDCHAAKTAAEAAARAKGRAA